MHFIVPLPWNTITTRTTRPPAFWGYSTPQPPRRPMNTHTIESYWITSQNKTKSKLWILRFCQKKMCKYEMDQMDGRTNGQGETSNPPPNLFDLKQEVWYYSNCFTINVRSSINCKERCPLFDIYCMSDKYVKAYISGLCRWYSRMVTVYSWQTDKPYCNNEFFSNMVSIFKTIPNA